GQSPAEVQVRLRKARQSVRRLRARIKQRDATLAKQSAELTALRSFTLNVFPAQVIPAALTDAVDRLRREHLTFLTTPQLHSLVQCVLEAEAAVRPGIIVEAGTARGGSAIAMALAKDPARPMKVYDVFGVIPPPTALDGAAVAARYAAILAGESAGPGGDGQYYGYRDDLLSEVKNSFSAHGVPVDHNCVELVPGLFQDTIAGDEPIALAHIDGDWYESTMTCLVEFGPRIVEGGRIVIDDYFTWAGCRAAVDEFVATHDEFEVEMRAKVHLVRRGSG
ncbi:MAG: TylF/MycF/NovP-related O-methyltransferase, partial [Nocardioides sp.]